METITLPRDFLTNFGNLALEVQRLVLRFMPFIILLVFAFGLVSFLLGSSKGKLDFKKYVFTPIFLFVLAGSYPTVIDITGKFYSLIINTFDKPEYKNFYLKYTGIEEELIAYQEKAEKSMDDYQMVLKKRRPSGLKIWFEDDPVKRKALIATQKKIDKDLEEAEGLEAGSSIKDIWDFFSISTVRIIRYIIDLTRNLALSLLVVFGCLAIMFESIPAFRGILNKWFKFYTAVTFWALTVCVLDAAFLSFAESGVASAKNFYGNREIFDTYIKEYKYYSPTNPALSMTEVVEASDFALKWYAYGGSQGLNVAVNVVMVIFYCITPFLTSLYIGGEQAGMFMSKVIGVGSMATQQIMQTATGGVASAAGVVGTVVQGQKGGAIGKDLISAIGSIGAPAGLFHGSSPRG